MTAIPSGSLPGTRFKPNAAHRLFEGLDEPRSDPVQPAARAARELRLQPAELPGAQHAFEIFPSIRSVQTVEYVEEIAPLPTTATDRR